MRGSETSLGHRVVQKYIVFADKMREGEEEVYACTHVRACTDNQAFEAGT